VTGNDITWPQVTGSDSEVTLFDGKSPGSGCRRQKTHMLYILLPTRRSFPRGGSQVTGDDSTDLRMLEVTLKWLIWPKVTWKCCRLKTHEYCTFHFLQGFSSQEEAVTWQEMTSRDLRWPEVTLKWRHLTGSNLEVAVEDQKLPYIAHFTSYKAVACRSRQSRGRKWRHLISGDQKGPRSDVIWPEVSWKLL